MDQDPAKISYMLDQLGMRYSPQTIGEFMKLYQGSYYDLQLILETQPNHKNFDEIWHVFKNQYQITHLPEKVFG